MLLNEVKATVRLAIPVVATQIAQISMGFVDTVMVGRLSSDALAGIALGNSVFFTILMVAMGLVMAVGPMVSQSFGAGNSDGVARSTRQGMWLATTLAVPAFLIIRNVESVLLWIGQAPETVDLTQRYLLAISWGTFPFLWFVALRSFIEGVSRPRPATVISVIAVLLNVGANYVLMFGKLGLPKMGLVGTGWASTIVFWFMFVALAATTVRSPSFKVYEIFLHLRRPDPRVFRELFHIGWPIGISYGIEAGLFMITAMMMGLLGTVALASHQIAIQCASITFMVPLGIGIASSVRVGQAVGRGDRKGVRVAGLVGVGIAATFMAGAAVVFWTLPRAVVALYLDVGDPANSEVVSLAISLLFVAAVFQLFDGVQVSAAGALRGIKDTRVPMFIGFLSYWIVGLSSGYIVGFKLNQGPVGLWWGLVLGLTVAAILLLWRFWHKSEPGVAKLGGQIGHDESQQVAVKS